MSKDETKSARTYSDGHPLDDVQYREYKLLLRPERFFEPERLEEYWRVVSRIAKETGVDVTTNKNAFHRLVREVLFYDTPEFDLYRNTFILRTRTFYDNGWPQRDHELTVKFRNADRDAAAALDMRTTLAGEVKIKFKEEILPHKIEVGGLRSLYSHNCVMTSPLIVIKQGIKDITDAFPALKCLALKDDVSLDLVNNVAVEEVEIDVGHFDFGHGYEAKATIAIWRNRATEESLVGEFAFQAKFDKIGDVNQKALALSEKFYRKVQTDAPEWILLGTTKTAMVYGLGKGGTVRAE